MLRFRESFRGYNRDDVNAYIEQLNTSFSKKEAELRAIISDMQMQENNSLDEIAKTNETKLSEMNNELENTRAEVERLKAELENTKSNLAAESAEKSRLYDSMTSQVGGIIIQANTNAEKIMADARVEAERILQNALSEARSTMAEAEKIKSEANIYAENRIRTARETCACEFNSIVESAGNELNAVSDNLKIKADLLLNTLKEKGRAVESNLNNY